MHFDNTLISILTLFQMMTQEGWMSPMFSAMDSRGIDKMPEYNASFANCIFFCIFMIVGFIFLVNLFVGVIIDNFNKIQDAEDAGGVFLTPKQRQWLEIQRSMMNSKLVKKVEPPKNKFQKGVFEMVMHPWFETFIMTMILLNMIVMAMRYTGMADWYRQMLEVLNLCFAFIFNLEMILKLIGLGFVRYFTLSSWNRFDCSIVIGTDLGLLMRLFNFGIDISTTVTIIRTFRILRVFRLIKTYGQLVVNTLINVFPQVSNILSLIFLMLFIFGVLGISLFAQVKYRDTYNEDYNFRSIFSAIVLLMKAATGEDWNKIMHDLARTDECTANQTKDEMERDGIDGCGAWYSYAYFLFFEVTVALVMMNLSIAAVINGLAAASKDLEGEVAKKDIESLIQVWAEYDPKATGFLPPRDLICLMSELPPPLGMYTDRFDAKGRKVKGRLKDIVIPDILSRIIKPDLMSLEEFLVRRRTKPLDFQKPSADEESEWIIHENRKIYIHKAIGLLFLKQMTKVPIYENNKCHFREVSKTLLH